ncbi:MAG TPA: 4Fe-4S dicluster domain-containing protein [Steroidobacteraceae bacterium]|nr:4Fe-4S dicluster domain-containing protein [Steroidobacteraceae bacterium]
MRPPPVDQTTVLISCEGLQALIDALISRDYEMFGPTVRDGAIIYDAIARVADLPTGWTDQQEAGRYRLQRRDDEAVFGFAVGPHSWKRFLHPPVERLWSMRRGEDGVTISDPARRNRNYAFFGVRACELHAIAIQDRILRDGPYPDTAYATRRRDAFIVAVNCAQAGGTCFCVSMQTGPKASGGFDLSLTELVERDRHDFLVEVGSRAGAALLEQIPCRPATAADRSYADRIIARTASRMGRTLDTDGIKELLQSNPDHPRWDEVAERCLSCGNCTMVCPTCFCTTVEDHGDLTGNCAERVRKWDSCFTLDFSYLHGGSVRSSARSRYRQWMTHKLASWINQFGSSGCVGCGRCITWCPTGIDITQEAAAIRAAPSAGKGEKHGGS